LNAWREPKKVHVTGNRLNALFELFGNQCLAARVRTSGKRVTVKSGSGVRIPVSPPKNTEKHAHAPLFTHPENLIIKPLFAPFWRKRQATDRHQ
jgi:hypothetical protein